MKTERWLTVDNILSLGKSDRTGPMTVSMVKTRAKPTYAEKIVFNTRYGKMGIGDDGHLMFVKENPSPEERYNRAMKGI